MVFAMRHGVRFYEAMGLNRRLLNFRYGVHIYEATRPVRGQAIPFSVKIS